MKPYLIYISLLCAAAAGASAQDVPRVAARLSADSIMIGDQFELTVRVEKDLMQVVDFPALESEGEVEVLSEGAVDTLAVQDRRQVLEKRYRMTIWREGAYNLGRIPALYADKNRVDTLLTADSLRIVVSTFDIDLARDKPRDIRRIPRLFGEWAHWLWLGLGALALAVGAVWLLRRFWRRIPFLAPKEVPAPHVEAIRKLEALRHQKLPQNGRQKQFYSSLTDILREYISRRWDVGAMEMTSAEITAALAPMHSAGQIDDRRWGDLRALLAAADMVKFAKHTPPVEDADADWQRAYNFIEDTKQVVDD